MDEKPKQVCVSFLLRRTGDKFSVACGRSDKFGQPPQVGPQLAGAAANMDDVLLAAIGPYLQEILMELKAQ